MNLPDWQDSDLQAAAPILDEWIGVYGLDSNLVYGLVSQESRFKPAAFLMDRNGGSFGLTQISLPTAQGLGYTGDGPGLYDPNVNVQFGLLYLRNRLDKYGDVGEALSAYNCGYPTGCAAGTLYANQVQERANYFASLAVNPVLGPPPDSPVDSNTPTLDQGGNVSPGVLAVVVGIAVVAAMLWRGRGR